MRHIVGGSPSVDTVHGTLAVVSVKGGGGEGLVGMGLGISGVHCKGEDAPLLLSVETDGGLLVSRGGDDTGLVKMRGRQEEIAALGTSGNGNVVVKGVSSPEEVADIVIELRSGGSGRTPGIVGEVVVAGAGIFAGIVILVVHVTHQVLLLGFRKPGGPGTGVLAGEIHLHGAFLALFGVDNHHTGRCAGTV